MAWFGYWSPAEDERSGCGLGAAVLALTVLAAGVAAVALAIGGLLCLG